MNAKALIVGAGSGLSASLAKLFSAKGYEVILAARDTTKLATLTSEINGSCVQCDGSDPESVNALYSGIDSRLEIVVYNPSARVRAPLVDLDPEEVRHSIDVTAFGSFLVGQGAARHMLKQDMKDGKRGTILFTGASAGVKGFAQSATFAMGKFAQRGLAQSMSRELHPQGVHVAWINIDGGIRNQSRPERIDSKDNPDSMLDPDEIALTYLHLVNQHRTAWSEEVAVRPWVERF